MAGNILRTRLFILIAWLSLVETSAHASERVAKCRQRETYVGAPLHAPFELSVLAKVPDARFEAASSEKLDKVIRSLRGRIQAPALTAAMAVPGKGIWRYHDAPPDAPKLFWASAGKSFTAVVILQLAHEGKLSLDQSVDRWVEGVPNGHLITVRDLLTHTSGLYSSNEDPKARATPRYRDAKTNLQIARQHGPLFCPGANWRYSNTGYDVLGEIIRKVDGKRVDIAITDRIIRPLGLHSMVALEPGAGSRGVAPLSSAKEKPIDPSWPGAAGSIAGDAADMARFWSALLSGQLLPTESLREMSRTLYPMFDSGTYYGLGVMLFDVPDGNERLLWLGHAGGTAGASAIIAWSPRDDAVVAVALTGDASTVPVANALLKALR